MKKLPKRLLLGIISMLVLWLIWAHFNQPNFTVGPPLPSGKVTPKLVAIEDRTILLAPDGSLWEWGQIPNSSGTNEFEFPQRLGMDTDWSDVAGCRTTILALKRNGSLWGWVSNNYGELASPPNSNPVYQPTRIGTETNWAKISVGYAHALALKTDGSLWAWGGLFNSRAGKGADYNPVPMTQIGLDHDWKTIAAGGVKSYALKRNGTLWSWFASFGPHKDSSPSQIESGTNWTSITVNGRCLLALQSNGSLWASGDSAVITGPEFINSSGISVRLIPIYLDRDWSEVHGGTECLFARKKDGSWWISGRNFYGQLALPRSVYFAGTSRAPSPGLYVPKPERFSFEFEPWAFSSGSFHTSLLTRDGILWTWGKRLGTKTSPTLNSIKDFANRKLAALPRHLRPFTVEDVLTDYTPHRLWQLPASIRASLDNSTTNNNSPPQPP